MTPDPYHDTAPADPDEARRRLLRALLAQESAAPAESAESAAERTGVLSAAQYRMWFHQHARPDSAAYNLAVAARLDGPLSAEALRTAFAGVVERHEILRTVYRTGPDGLPSQHVLPAAEPVIDIEDVANAENAEAAADTHGTGDAAGLADAVRWAAEAAALPFDLAAQTPLRLRLYRTGPDRHLLLVVLHHIACDDLSWDPLFGDVSAGYRNATCTPAIPPAPLPLQYGEHAARERPAPEADLAYWRERLTPPPPPAAPLPDLPRPATAGEAGARVAHPLAPGVHERLTALARTASVTPFMALLAGYLTLLHRYTGQSDLCVATPVVHREAPGVRDLVGNFGNSVVLRVDLSGNPSFRDLLGRVRAECLATYAHQGVPFDRVVEAVRPYRGAGRSPLADTMFSARTGPLDGLDLPGVSVTEVAVPGGTARFDLAVEAVATGAGTELGATYRTELYTEATVARLLEHLGRLLGGAVDAPDTPVADLPMLSEAQWRQIVRDWNATDRPGLLTPDTLHGLFEARVRSAPDDEALVDGDDRWTYRRLDAAAGRLARRLAGAGAGPGRLVGVHLERSAGLVVGMLAALKTGAAFVPLEPAWPARRVEEVVADASPAAVLSRDADRWGDVPVFDPDEPDGEAGPDEDGFASVHRPGGLAYVIYTSGSTGRPKGAMITHAGIRNRLPWQSELLGLAPGDGVLHKAPLGFDISVNEIFLPLSCGARLVLAPPGADKDPDALIAVTAKERVAFVYVTSTMLDAMLERPGIAAVAPGLRHVWCGGEVLTPELFARFRERLPHSTMYHGYGPAEATIGVSCEVYRGESRRTGVTIGRPNPNTRLYVLGPGLRPVPPGVPGEIHVGGVQVADGYLGDLRRTADRFVPDPFGDVPGARLYATGDLGRLRPDGVIEFLGRADRQIKIRGHRVELEEVESVLARHPEVRQAVVLLREDTPGTGHLAAYCLARSDAAAPAEDAVRAFAAERLPEYAVPQSVQVLPELPLMPSGKVDRAALAALPARVPVSAPYLDPRDGLERAVARVWAEVLGVPQVGARDNFFDLGGHSLLTLRVQAALERELGRRVSVVDLFAHPTVADLARLLDDRERAASADGAPAPDEAGARVERRRAVRDRAAARRTTTTGTGPQRGAPRT
ncbi:non-ribosomal peptide synthetase [Streptomyces niveiscabiei]|uniref:non-ribosomal peptide synthetase n=1 Tax=Streptomyces niveiscabiei TaxID=164115 RepID=UPI0006EB5FC0|nr:non-ribosomal peptide synthetase [Streptomyces niveiscabiei]